MKTLLGFILPAVLALLVSAPTQAQYCRQDGSTRCQSAALTGGNCPSGWSAATTCGGSSTPTPTPVPTAPPATGGTPVPVPAVSLIQVELGGEWFGKDLKGLCDYFAKDCKDKIGTSARTACIYLPNGGVVRGYTLQTSVKKGELESLFRLLYNQTGKLDDGGFHIDAPRHHPPMPCANTIVVPRDLAVPVVIPPGSYVWWAGLYCGDGSGPVPWFESQATLDFELAPSLQVQRVAP